MKLNFIPLTIEYAKIIESWRYAGFEKKIFMQPYFESYQKTGKLIGPGGCEGFAAMHENELIGLFEFYNDLPFMNIGLALKPEWTGKGWGSDFVLQGIDFGVRHFHYEKKYIELTVNELNIPAIRIYEKAGFEILRQSGDEITMRKEIN